MLLGLVIVVDEDFALPTYADPSPDDFDADLWEALCERILECVEGERGASGSEAIGSQIVAWKCHLRIGVTFGLMGEGISSKHADAYLKQLSQRYMDEVEDARRPEREGVVDVVVDVIPPWEDSDDD
jgi:hypothetical protein